MTFYGSVGTEYPMTVLPFFHVQSPAVHLWVDPPLWDKPKYISLIVDQYPHDWWDQFMSHFSLLKPPCLMVSKSSNCLAVSHACPWCIWSSPQWDGTIRVFTKVNPTWICPFGAPKKLTKHIPGIPYKFPKWIHFWCISPLGKSKSSSRNPVIKHQLFRFPNLAGAVLLAATLTWLCGIWGHSVTGNPTFYHFLPSNIGGSENSATNSGI